MDQLKEVKYQIAAYFAGIKNMKLAERIRYEYFLDYLYKISIKTLNGERITIEDFANLLWNFKNCDISIIKLDTSWSSLRIHLRQTYLIHNTTRTNFVTNSKHDYDDKTIMFYIYSKFDEVIKQNK